MVLVVCEERGLELKQTAHFVVEDPLPALFIHKFDKKRGNK
jgi:hypothetical protein